MQSPDDPDEPDEPEDFLATLALLHGTERGRFQLNLSDAWNAALHPFGGMVSALAAQAMTKTLNRPEHRLRTLTTVFEAPVASGPIDIEVTVLREGRGMSQLSATVSNLGADAGHTTLAVFGQARRGFEFTDVAYPAVPPPSDCRPRARPPADFARFDASFFHQVEVRGVDLHMPWETDWEAGPARSTRWMRYRRPPLLGDGRMEPIALIPLCDTMPPAITQKLGSGHEPFLAPSCDLTVHLLDDTDSEWLLVANRCVHAGAGYGSCRAEIWDENGKLVAHAAQLVYLRRGF